MRKYWYKTSILCMILSAFTACSDDDVIDDPEPEETVAVGAYVINTGNWGANNGSIQWLDIEAATISSDLYAAANGKGIGDAQDLCVYGSKIYIACSTSAKIEIVNRSDFSIAQTLNLANDAGEAIQPRYLTAYQGNVYYTAYDGTVSKIDTTSLSVTASIEVGSYPEALSATNGKLYVNISGYGSENKIAVVDVASFTKTKDLEVVLNPYDVNFVGDDGYVYFVSCGDYGTTTPSTLQRIDPSTDAVTSLFSASKAAVKDGKIYYIYADYYSADPGVIGVYDIEAGTSSELLSYSSFQNPQFIAVDPSEGMDYLYIGDSPYSSLNDLYVYTTTGIETNKFETGYYTTNMRFVNNND